ncbi:MAG: serine O-acetyltransferase [Terracidiphilus sp.]
MVVAAMLKEMLFADLKRQYDLEGRTGKAVGLAGVSIRLLHPRFLPLVLFRLGRASFLSRIPVLPQLCSYANIVLFGLEISPRCEIGPGLFIPHTSGTVVGAWRIGRNATIFQNVTLGSKKLDMGFEASSRPELGDCVTLGAGCKVLGGIKIGDYATVGANSVVLESVEANSTVVGVPARTVAGNAAEDRG